MKKNPANSMKKARNNTLTVTNRFGRALRAVQNADLISKFIKKNRSKKQSGV